MDMVNRFDARREQMLKELASDLADLVESGDMTPEEANEWLARKADQWSV
jgi:polyhydroxyalkanoate synthesis regulator phasin